jgi:2-polyprenyl-6-methoxyphenol hydroxylase-like FAD-dependent oxidoreductase
MNKSTEVLIAGAGIGGLTVALTLHAKGIRSTVIESAHQLKPLGVGINLLPHAVRELDELGLSDELVRLAAEPEKISFFDESGQVLFSEPRGIAGGYGWPQYAVHRGELQMLLLSAVRERLGTDAVRTGMGLTGFDALDGHVTAHTAAGDVDARILVGADGLHSVVRARLHPEPDPLMWSGIRMYRGAAEMPAFLDGRTMAIVKGPDGIDLITYPIGGGFVNWVVQVPESAPGPLPGGAGWNAPVDPETVRRHLADWRLGWLDAADMVGRTATVLEYPMVDRDPLPWWGRGRVTLLGDAAHPMYPVGANGGSQAIVDARVLANELHRDPDAGLRAYENDRRAATADVIAANREMHQSGATHSPDDLAKVTATYRSDTDADKTSA